MKTFQKPLTSGEEAEYIRLLKEGEKEQAREAKDILIERNLRLVAHVAKKYQNVDEDMEDLISIGCIGLIKAIDTFDASKGRLATYACRCIDNELLMLLRSKKKTSKEVSLFEPIGQDKDPFTCAKSRTRRNSALAIRGVPRLRKAISTAAERSQGT